MGRSDAAVPADAECSLSLCDEGNGLLHKDYCSLPNLNFVGEGNRSLHSVYKYTFWAFFFREVKFTAYRRGEKKIGHGMPALRAKQREQNI